MNAPIGDSIAKEKILQILMRPLQRPLEVALETVRGQDPGQGTPTVIQDAEVIQKTVNVKTVQVSLLAIIELDLFWCKKVPTQPRN